ncbi:hypothetical protein Ae201684_008055 [Aphanomyces euteiches]|uniref:Uncharacterized protein n=1 Tax=Aphanomyces euteiches TaxID=100861 RepID=A0A6G0X6D1_9STRA|nr:hypothetical protein Ae201684_008055 [Aphanomyces euteiches]
MWDHHSAIPPHRYIHQIWAHHVLKNGELDPYDPPNREDGVELHYVFPGQDVASSLANNNDLFERILFAGTKLGPSSDCSFVLRPPPSSLYEKFYCHWSVAQNKLRRNVLLKSPQLKQCVKRVQWCCFIHASK